MVTGNTAMYKEMIAMILISILIILTATYCMQALQLILDFHDMVDNMLAYVFSSGKIGSLIAQLVSYLVLPLISASVFAAGYFLFRRHFSPHFMMIAWVVWLVQTTALVLYS